MWEDIPICLRQRDGYRRNTGPAGTIKADLILGWGGLEQTGVKGKHRTLFNKIEGISSKGAPQGLGCLCEW